MAAVLALLGPPVVAQEEPPIFTCDTVAGDLVRNGGAEEGASATGRTATVAVPGWRLSGGRDRPAVRAGP